MRRHWATWTILTGAACFALASSFAGETNDGKWSIHRSEQPEKVQFALYGSGVHDFTTISNWPKTEFTGLDLAQDTQFTVARDAGKFEFDGTVRNGEGAGSFKFFPDANYAQEMQALGFGSGGEIKQIHLAVHNVSLSFARDMKNAKLQNLDTDKLLAFRIHGVSRKYLDDLWAAGHVERDSDLLIAFRIHGVTPAFVAELQKLGFQRPSSEQLVALRVHGVTPEYITDLQRRGVKDLTIDKLVAMKIHGLD